MWALKESAFLRTEAIPPWALNVFESSRVCLQTIITEQFSAASMAARRPAMPVPIMRQSVNNCGIDEVSMSIK